MDYKAHKKATNTKKEVHPTGKPGKTKKMSQPKEKMHSVLEQQGGQTAEEARGNPNSQDSCTSWKDYKLHLDVTDSGIPVSGIVTGANVHDSQVSHWRK